MSVCSLHFKSSLVVRSLSRNWHSFSEIKCFISFCSVENAQLENILFHQYMHISLCEYYYKKKVGNVKCENRRKGAVPFLEIKKLELRANYNVIKIISRRNWAISYAQPHRSRMT